MSSLAFAAIVIVWLLASYIQYQIIARGNTGYDTLYCWDVESPNKLTAPLYFGAVTVVGSSVYGLWALVTGNNEGITDLVQYLTFVSRTILFSAALMLKALFGPLAVAWVLTGSITLFAVERDLQLRPIFGLLLEWTFGSVPLALQLVYTAAVGVYALSTSVYDLSH